MTFVKNVLNLISFGKPASYVGVLCPSRLSCDGYSVQTSLLVGHRRIHMPMHKKKKPMGKKKKKKGGKKKRSRG